MGPLLLVVFTQELGFLLPRTSTGVQVLTGPCRQRPGDAGAAVQSRGARGPAGTAGLLCYPACSATRPSSGTHLMGQAALQHAVPGNLTHVTGAEFEDLGGDGILLHQGLL